ncbi:MAG: gliding motility-associated C-terminal domain-containing protein [Bacteroidetes bacterium]|nr:gliding motility-associated C-terminal domain-containing protein [Bacteroidota bacterium]
MKWLRLLCWGMGLLLMASPLRSQEFSNKGKEFWLTYPAHVDGTSSVMGLYITASVNTTGTLELAGGAPFTFSVQANVVTRIFLNSTGTGVVSGTSPQYFGLNTAVYQSQSNGVSSKSAIRIASNDPLVVYSHIIYSARSAATLALPTQVLGNEYIAPSMPSANAAGGNGAGVGEIAVVASQANTQITILPTANGRNGELAGVPIVVNLPNAGDCYQFQSAPLADLTGTKITSAPAAGTSGCRPVAVFSASTWSAFDCGGASGGDNLFQQLFPTKSWGKTFVTAPFKNRNYDLFRIIPKSANAKVTIQENGNNINLGAANYNSTGNFYFYTSANPLIISSDEPISVAQYITSTTCKTGCTNSPTDPSTCYADPEMVMLSPVEQTLQDVTFFSAHKSYVPLNQTAIEFHYVNIIINKKFKSSLTIDGKAPIASFVDIQGSNYSYLQEDLTTSSQTNPIHRVLADSSFSAIVYGYGKVESYGYNGGTNVKDFTPKPTIQNPFNRIDSAFTCTNTPFTFSVPLNYLPTSLQWDFALAPRISPATTINQPTGGTPDSTVIINGQTIRYYSTGITYQFGQTNTAAVLDTIRLYTTSATPDGCGSNSQLVSLPIRVYSKPVAQFNILSSGCITDSVKLFSTSTIGQGQITRWRWNKGTGPTDSKNDSSYYATLYSAAGNYQASLEVISDIGCLSDPFTRTINVANRPIAGWVVPAVACVNSVVNFSDVSVASSGTISTRIWNLDDGSGTFSRTTQDPVQTTYTSWGPKKPTLQVVLSNGCTSEVFSPVAPFIVNPLPEPGFISPAICLNDANAKFIDTTKIADGTAGFTYLWNFNAASPAVSPGPIPLTSTAAQPSITYNKADYYIVRLQVTSAVGCANTFTKNFTVNGTTPKADFMLANALPYCSERMLVLQDKSTVNFGGITRLTIQWDYTGNPANQTDTLLPGLQQTYPRAYSTVAVPSATSYTIKMKAYSGGNTCVDSVSKVIQVFPTPQAAFTATDTQFCSNDQIQFTDLSNGYSSAIQNWNWNLGKGYTSAIQNPKQVYNDSGTAVVKLFVKNFDGCVSDTASLPITIFPLPVLDLPNEIRTLAGATVPLKPDYVYGNFLQYLWSPDTYLNSDTAAIPLATATDDITYLLTLTGIGGCAVTDTVFLRVLKGPEIPNAFSPNGDGINDVWRIKYLEYYSEATVQIFNRYGQLVYLTTGYSVPWDGKFKGTPLPVGTYYYIINPKNGREIMKGSVTIVR